MTKARKFPRSLIGYAPSAVDNYLDGLAREAEDGVAQLRQEADRVHRDNANLKGQVENFQKEIEGLREKERAVAQAIIAAQMRASSIEEEARNVVEEQKRRVLAEIAVKRAEMNSVRAEMERFRATLSHALSAIEGSLSSPPAAGVEEVEGYLRGDSGGSEKTRPLDQRDVGGF